MVTLTDEQALLLRTVMGSNWQDFVNAAEGNGFSEADCDSLYVAVGGEE